MMSTIKDNSYWQNVAQDKKVPSVSLFCSRACEDSDSAYRPPNNDLLTLALNTEMSGNSSIVTRSLETMQENQKTNPSPEVHVVDTGMSNENNPTQKPLSKAPEMKNSKITTMNPYKGK